MSPARSRPWRATSARPRPISSGILRRQAAVSNLCGEPPSLALELAALVFVGYGSITFNSLAKTTLQLAAKPEMRGRVMALWGLAWLGSTPIGGPIVGWAGQTVGARWSLVIGGGAALACGILALPALTRIDRRAMPTPSPPVASSVHTARLNRC
ncbi:MAG: MFS transporter [Streptosporangiaceae bacterium]